LLIMAGLPGPMGIGSTRRVDVAPASAVRGRERLFGFYARGFVDPGGNVTCGRACAARPHVIMRRQTVFEFPTLGTVNGERYS
jgi:hypothetical protein